MPESDKPDLKAGQVPQKPRNYDEAAQSFSRNEENEKQKSRAVSEAWEERQQNRRDDATRQANATEKPGPAERLAGKVEMTPAQQEMQAKRDAARQQDRQQAQTLYHDKQYVKLPER